MPEHVHLLLTEPERTKLSVALQMLKQNVARRLRDPEGGTLWQPRYYDFNVWSYAKQTEKLRYIHRNPVRRGLVRNPEEWAWSSFRHYLSGVEGGGGDRVAMDRAQAGADGSRAFDSCERKSKSPPCRNKRDKGGAPNIRVAKGWASQPATFRTSLLI